MAVSPIAGKLARGNGAAGGCAQPDHGLPNGIPDPSCPYAGNGAASGGLKAAATNGWFAARPSGTEGIYKIYAESFRGAEHLCRIQEEAHTIVNRTLAGLG